ncbi:MAG: GW domain-containing glycosaminoglycan-binding protein [Sporolactobacillus sp.]
MKHLLYPPFKLISSLAVFLLIAGLFSYFPVEAKSTHTYYVHRTSKLYSSSTSGSFSRYVPVNAKLSTSSKSTSKRYKVTYNGQTGYVYRSNLWSRRTTVTRYIHKNSYLYYSRDKSKGHLQKIYVNKSLTTDSNLNSTMYHVNYKGKRGYVYKVNLSTSKTPVTKFVVKASRLYKNYSRTSRYSGTIPVNTVLTTTSPQSNKLFWVNYNGRGVYVYAVNLGNEKLNYAYNNPVSANTYGVVSSGGNHGIWDQPYGIDGAKSVGNIVDYERVPLTVLAESKVGSTVWYQVAVDGNTLGWIHKSIVQITSDAAADGSIPHLAVANVSNTQGTLNQSPSGGIISSLNIYANLKLKIDMIADNGQWVHVKKYTAGTSLGWVHAADLSIQDVNSSTTLNVDYNNVSIASSNAPIFDDQAHFVGYSGEFNASGRSIQIGKERQVENEEMYRISFNHHVIGWVRSNAINVNNPTQAYKRVKDGSESTPIRNGQAGGDSPDQSNQVDHMTLADYSNRMIEVIKTSNDWSFIKYNDWYGQQDKDIDIGWVPNSTLEGLNEGTDTFKLKLNTQSGNQQGLAYDAKDGIFYVGYDQGNGNGKIVAYYSDGSTKETPTLPLGHACALSYYGGKLYEISSAGDHPVLRIFNASDLSEEPTTTTLTNFPNYVAMMTAKDANTLILLTESRGDDSFYYYNIDSRTLTGPISTAKMGVVQGLQYDNDKLYFLANDYITVLDEKKMANQGLVSITDRFYFTIPKGDPSESEGLSIDNNGNLFVGFGNNTIYGQTGNSGN